MVCSSQLSRFDGYSQLAPVWSNQLAISACISDPSPKLENVWKCIKRRCLQLRFRMSSIYFAVSCSHWSINSRGRTAVFAMAYVQASNSTLVYSIFKFWTSLNCFKIFRTCIWLRIPPRNDPLMFSAVFRLVRSLRMKFLPWIVDVLRQPSSKTSLDLEQTPQQIPQHSYFLDLFSSKSQTQEPLRMHGISLKESDREMDPPDPRISLTRSPLPSDTKTWILRCCHWAKSSDWIAVYRHQRRGGKWLEKYEKNVQSFLFSNNAATSKLRNWAKTA